MKLIDNISIDAIKANQDAYLNESVSSLLDEKTSAFEASGLESLISGPDSIFNTIKRLIGTTFAMAAIPMIKTPIVPIEPQEVPVNNEKMIGTIKAIK